VPFNAKPKNKMATKNRAIDLTRHLIACGVKIISLPGGFVQLMGKYGSVFLTHDITALGPRQLEQLCGDVVVS
jgi:hypothetical protein